MDFYSLILENKIPIPTNSSPITHSGKQHHQKLNISLQKVREASLRLHTEKSTFHLKGAFFVLYHFGT